MKYQSKKSIAQPRTTLALILALTGVLSSLACDSEAAKAVAAERVELEKAKGVLAGVIKKTTDALAKGGHENATLFYRYQMKKLADDASAVTSENLESDGTTVTSNVSDGITVYRVEVPSEDLVKTLKALAVSAPALWVEKIEVEGKTSKVHLTTWPGGKKTLSIARRGGVPSFNDVKLSKDLRRYQPSPTHTPKNENKVLFDEVKAKYDELEKLQNKLLAQGHSQGVQVLARSHITLAESVARLPKFAAEFALMGTDKTRLFGAGTFVPGPLAIDITAAFAPSIDIIAARKSARGNKRAIRGDAPAKGAKALLVWETGKKFTVLPVVPEFKLPQGFNFEVNQ